MISVCLASYNGERYIEDQIKSILPQLGNDDELIISDDGSTDSTIELVQSFNDSRIKLIKNHNRHGIIGNFENALKNTKGDYIFLSDQDDVWVQNKINICMNYLTQHDCVLHNCYVTDENLNVLSKSLFSDINAKRGFYNNLIKNSYTGCCMAFNRKVLHSVLPFPHSKRFYHDQWIGLIAELRFKTLYINSPLIYFRRHKQNSSSAAGKSNLNIFKQIKYRLSLLYNIIYHG